MFLKTLSEYLQLVKVIPSVGHEILNGLTEILSVSLYFMFKLKNIFTFIKKLWNSRSCQLVLGAGAMTMANLKSITATNLGKYLI